MSQKNNTGREQEKVDNEKLQEAVGNRIREIREKKGITQTELAIIMNGRDRQVVQRLEKGKTNCSLNLLRLVAESLGVHVKDLLK